MTRKDNARYMFWVLIIRGTIVIAGGAMLFVLMWSRVISENAGVPLLAVLIGGAGLSPIGSGAQQSAAQDPVVEPVPNQRIAATLNPPEHEGTISWPEKVSK